MGELNPLDWAAAPFLSLYVALAGGCLLVLGLWRNRLQGHPRGDTASALGVLHLAYLAGGADRAARAALVGLLEAGGAVPDRKRGVLRFDPSVTVPAEFEPFRHVYGGEASREAFQATFAPSWQRLPA